MFFGASFPEEIDMKTIACSLVLAASAVMFAGMANAASVSEREYKRGYDDCLRGEYDQNQHGASYKRGCRAAEESGKSTGHTISKSADQGLMHNVCYGAVIGRFNPHARTVRILKTEHQNYGWGVFGNVVLDDGATADFVCMFSSNGRFKRVNASEPMGASYEMDHEGYCPPDVSEADRYKYPACN
jgi:hypothetical protein